MVIALENDKTAHAGKMEDQSDHGGTTSKDVTTDNTVDNPARNRRDIHKAATVIDQKLEPFHKLAVKFLFAISGFCGLISIPLFTASIFIDLHSLSRISCAYYNTLSDIATTLQTANCLKYEDIERKIINDAEKHELELPLRLARLAANRYLNKSLGTFETQHPEYRQLSGNIVEQIVHFPHSDAATCNLYFTAFYLKGLQSAWLFYNDNFLGAGPTVDDACRQAIDKMIAQIK